MDFQTVLLLLKVSYAGYVLVLIVAYWRYYGPSNFLWFSDLALFVTGLALWLESPLLASMPAVSVTLLEMGWLAGFLAGLCGIGNRFGVGAYMFQPEIPRHIRGLSLFHVWLPFLQLWLVWRLGYDRRACCAQTLFAWVVLLLCYGLTTPALNINWVFGPGTTPQRRIAPLLYLLLLLAIFPLCFYLPTHLVFRQLFPSASP